MKLVIIESPYRELPGEEPRLSRGRNFRYLQACILDCLKRGESPYASHQMLTDALLDSDAKDRELGLNAGFAWHFAAEKSVVYTDRGITAGMQRGIAHAEGLGIPVEYRQLGGQWTKPSTSQSSSAA